MPSLVPCYAMFINIPGRPAVSERAWRSGSRAQGMWCGEKLEEWREGNLQSECIVKAEQNQTKT